MKNLKYLFLTILILSLFASLLFIVKKKSDKIQIQNETPPNLEQNEFIPDTKKLTEHPDSIPKMSEKEYNGSDLKLGKILEERRNSKCYGNQTGNCQSLCAFSSHKFRL